MFGMKKVWEEIRRIWNSLGAHESMIDGVRLANSMREDRITTLTNRVAELESELKAADASINCLFRIIGDDVSYDSLFASLVFCRDETHLTIHEQLQAICDHLGVELKRRPSGAEAVKKENRNGPAV